MDILGSDVEHGRGRRGVDVVASLERPDQTRILRKVGKTAFPESAAEFLKSNPGGQPYEGRRRR